MDKVELLMRSMIGFSLMYSRVFNAGVDALDCLKHGDIERAEALIKKSHIDAEDMYLKVTDTIDVEEIDKMVEAYKAKYGKGV